MNNKNSDFVKGVGAGIITGIVATTVGKVMLSGNRKSITKTAGKTMRAVGNIAESINYMLK